MHLRDAQPLRDLTLRQLQPEPQHHHRAAAPVEPVEPGTQVEPLLDLRQRLIGQRQLVLLDVVQRHRPRRHARTQRVQHGLLAELGRLRDLVDGGAAAERRRERSIDAATARSSSATDRGTRTGAACCRTQASISPITNGAA